VIVAISLLGERPGMVAMGGAALIVGGAFFSQQARRSCAKRAPAGASRSRSSPAA
jgi:drug/metabolite transporter (DMT)-like permease